MANQKKEKEEEMKGNHGILGISKVKSLVSFLAFYVNHDIALVLSKSIYKVMFMDWVNGV